MAGKLSMKDVSARAGDLAREMGYELVEVARTKEAGGLYLRVYLDQEQGISLSDCERFHRAFLSMVEDADYDFLEVCSPGIDRPLKTQRDFDRKIGSMVELRLFQAQDGKRIFEGRLLSLKEGEITLQVGTQVFTFLQKAAALVRPLLDEEELKAAQEIDFAADEE